MRKAKSVRKILSLRDFAAGERDRSPITSQMAIRMPATMREAIEIAALVENVTPAVLTRWLIYRGLLDLGMEPYGLPLETEIGEGENE